LTALTRKHGAPQAIADRARIVLAAASGLLNKQIAAKHGVCQQHLWLALLSALRAASFTRLDPAISVQTPGQARKLLSTGKVVLFSALPYQNKGLTRYWKRGRHLS
jgi:hypothetical protein